MALASAVGVMGLDRWGRFAAMAAQTAEVAMASSPALRGAVIGVEEGAAAGAETGPGMAVTALVGGLIGAGLGILAGRPGPNTFATPAKPAPPNVLQTPAQTVSGDAAGAPPARVPTQNPALPAGQGSPSNTVSTPADTPEIGTVMEAKPPTGARPDLEPGPGGVVVPEDRREHILIGDVTGGGHRPGQNVPGKSEFPTGWSDDRIIDAIKEVANDPALSRGPGRFGSILVYGSRDGVDMIFVVKRDKTTVVSGFPTNRPGNPK